MQHQGVTTAISLGRCHGVGFFHCASTAVVPGRHPFGRGGILEQGELFTGEENVSGEGEKGTAPRMSRTRVLM